MAVADPAVVTGGCYESQVSWSRSKAIDELVVADANRGTVSTVAVDAVGAWDRRCLLLFGDTPKYLVLFVGKVSSSSTSTYLSFSDGSFASKFNTSDQ